MVIEDLQLPLPGDLGDIKGAAALVGGIVEDRIPALLNSVRNQTWDKTGALTDYEFRRDTIGFPDVLLVERADPTKVLFRIEAKTWYVLSADSITARFLIADQYIPAKTLLVIVAWTLDGIVSGSPKLVGVFSDDAKRLAKKRDSEWVANEPTKKRVVQPSNPRGTALNLTKMHAIGEQKSGTEWKKDSDNFGKIDRFHDAKINEFKETMFNLRAAGKSLKDWHRFFKS